MKHARPARQKRRAAAALRYASLDLLCSFPYDDGLSRQEPGQFDRVKERDKLSFMRRTRQRSPYLSHSLNRTTNQARLW